MVSHMEAQLTQSTAALEAQITELAGHLNAGNHRFLVLIAELDRRNGWSDSATQSCAHWLNWKCGIDMGAAREKVRVARALESLPRVSAAMARGELSYSKVRAITRVACAETEELLLSIALHGTANHVEKTVSGFRRARQGRAASGRIGAHCGELPRPWRRGALVGRPISGHRSRGCADAAGWLRRSL